MVSQDARRRAPLRSILVAALLLAAPRAALAQSSAAEALFEQGRTALAANDLETACARFRASDQIEPAAGTRANLADCEAQRGKVATAWATYKSALSKLAPGDSRAAVLQERIAKLEARLPKLVLTLVAGSPKETTVAEGDATIGMAATYGVPLPLDPGVHHLAVGAPGRTSRTLNVTLAEGKTTTLAVEAGGVAGAAPGGAAPVPGGADAQGRDMGAAPAPASLSHAWQVGAVLRGDIDAMRGGFVAAPGLSFGLGDYLEINTVALLGANKGVEPGLTGYFLKGAWKPRLSAGVPIFLIDGARPGVHGAAGVQWDPLRHFGAFVDAGVAGFPSLPAGYQKVVFLPSVGVQARL